MDTLVGNKVATLSPKQRALLEHLLKERGVGTSMLPIPSQPRDGRTFPLSFAQQRLWFDHYVAQDSTRYNHTLAFHITGALDPVALARSFRMLVQRHETLRTTFELADRMPVQRIHPELPAEWHVHDLRAEPAPERMDTALRLAHADAIRPFDLETGPLVRICLLRLDDLAWVLSCTLHHIITDRWSIGILLRELNSVYSSIASAGPLELPVLPIQYADFAHWQRQNLQGKQLDQLLEYWRHQLTPPQGLLPLPADHPRPPVQTFRGAKWVHLLPRELAAGVREISRGENSTLFAVLLGAFQILLHRYTDQEVIDVGTVIAGRNRMEVEGLIGFFINMLVLRANLSGDIPARDFLRRIRDVVIGAFDHQDLPFERLVELLRPERDSSYTPLFQVAFALQNTPSEAPAFHNLAIEPVEIDTEAAPFDLTLLVEDGYDELPCMWVYNADIFAATTIERMARHFMSVLSELVTRPTGPIGQIELLTASERSQILTGWNETWRELTGEECLHRRFEAWAAATPDAPALAYDDRLVTYQELNQRANQLAHYLQTLGIGPERAVAVCFERSIEMIIGILGVLKAGGYYLPLDPAYPAERLRLMLDDCRPGVLLTHRQVVRDGRPLLQEGRRQILLDEEWPAIAAYPRTNTAHVVEPDNLAYMIYTSGSTGRPKGVLVPHRGLQNVVAAQQHLFGAGPGDVVLQFASLSFDASAFEIAMSLATGATLRLAASHALLPGPELAERLDRWDISIVTLSPSALAALPQEPLPRLRVLTVAGEACPAELVAQWSSSRSFFNLYGPTETTIWATAAACTPSPAPPTIGGPIQNTRVYILDRYGYPAPIGVAGEIFIGGIGVTRGYHKRPELTAEKFVPDPFSGLHGNRLYRTGDVARYRLDGAIEFMGRRDHQVKIRGFRIELDEIAQAIQRHPAVGQAIVLAQKDPTGTAYLAASITPALQRAVQEGDQAGQARVDIGELRAFLKSVLPEHMIPSIFFELAAFPLTPNGKVDRRALALQSERLRACDRATVAPRNEAERALVEIWEQLLDERPIGVTDNFFELGGHSLLAVRLTTHIQQRFGQAVPLLSLLQHPTIEGLAGLLHQGESAAWSPLVALRPGTRPPFFCVHPSGGNVLCYTDVAQQLEDGWSFYGVQAYGLDGQQAPLTDIPAMAEAYVHAIRDLQPTGPYYLGGHSFGGFVAFEMACQLHAQGQPVGLLAILDTLAPTQAGLPAPNMLVVDSEGEIGWLVEIGRVIGRSLNTPLEFDPAEMRRLASSDERYAYVLRHLQRVHFVPPDADPAIVRGLLQVNYANTQAALGYRPGYYPGQITLFRAEAASLADYPLFTEHLADPARGWQQYSGAPVVCVDVPGDHISMVARPAARTLGERLTSALNQAVQCDPHS